MFLPRQNPGSRPVELWHQGWEIWPEELAVALGDLDRRALVCYLLALHDVLLRQEPPSDISPLVHAGTCALAVKIKAAADDLDRVIKKDIESADVAQGRSDIKK